MHMWLPQSTPPTLAAHGGNQGKLARTVYNATRTVVGGTDLLSLLLNASADTTLTTTVSTGGGGQQ